MKDYIVLNGNEGSLVSNNRLQFNLAPHYFPNLPQDGNADITMKLNSILFRIATVDNDAVDGTCIIDTNMGFGNMTSTDGVAVLGIAEVFMKTATGGTQYVSPVKLQNDIKLKISKFSTIQIGVYYEDAYLDLSENQANFTAILEIEYKDNSIKELK